MLDPSEEKRAKGVRYKVILSGDILEIFQYSKCIPIGFEVDRVDYSKDREGKKRQDSIFRARANIRRIIWANATAYTKFMTLTYAENMQDYEKFKRDFEAFVLYMKRKGYKLKYLYILEKQERGAIHIHLVVFNEEYIPFEVINAAWGHGTTDIHVLKDVRNVGAYICKYLGKETFDSFSDLNYRSYRCSLGLKRPIQNTLSNGCLSNVHYLKMQNEHIYSDSYEIVVPRENFVTDRIEVMYSQYRIR